MVSSPFFIIQNLLISCLLSALNKRGISDLPRKLSNFLPSSNKQTFKTSYITVGKIQNFTRSTTTNLDMAVATNKRKNNKMSKLTPELEKFKALKEKKNKKQTPPKCLSKFFYPNLQLKHNKQYFFLLIS